MSRYPPTGNPRMDEYGRQRRTAYDDRALFNLDRAGDPYASRPRDNLGRERFERDRFERTHREDDRRAPLVTITRLFEDQGRRSQDPMERSGPYGGFARLSETPPPRPSRSRLDSYSDRFGAYERPDQTHRNERLFADAMGPPNPFTGARARDELTRRRQEPYGGLGEPRNPFAPGGAGYATRWHTGPPGNPDVGLNELERSRRDYARSQVGESWGVAAWNEYERGRRGGL